MGTFESTHVAGWSPGTSNEPLRIPPNRIIDNATIWRIIPTPSIGLEGPPCQTPADTHHHKTRSRRGDAERARLPLEQVAVAEHPRDAERLDSPIERIDSAAADTFIPESVDQLLAHSRRYPLLTPAQEIDLAKRIERGDLYAKELLVNSNLRLVASNARRYQNQGLPLADLVQEGMLGLIRASEKFDWRKGFRFSTYATLWIRQAIQRGLENSGRTIRLPVHVAQRSRKVGRVERELSVRLGPRAHARGAGRRDRPADRAGRGGAPPARRACQPRSADRRGRRHGARRPAALGRRGAGGARPGTTSASASCTEAISQLPETERTVLTLRFGTGREEPQTLTAIGKRLGFSAERASQLEQRALKKLAESPELAALREAA